jgi:hypothetical protein
MEPLLIWMLDQAIAVRGPSPHEIDQVEHDPGRECRQIKTVVVVQNAMPDVEMQQSAGRRDDKADSEHNGAQHDDPTDADMTGQPSGDDASECGADIGERSSG